MHTNAAVDPVRGLHVDFAELALNMARQKYTSLTTRNKLASRFPVNTWSDFVSE